MSAMCLYAKKTDYDEEFFQIRIHHLRICPCLQNKTHMCTSTVHIVHLDPLCLAYCSENIFLWEICLHQT